MRCQNNVPAESLKKLPEFRTVMTESAAGASHLAAPFRRGRHPLKATAKRSGARKRVATDKPAAKGKQTSKLLTAVLTCLDDAKAEDVTAIDLDGKGALADQMVIATGRSNRHVSAIADQLIERLKAEGFRNLRIEGVPQCDWVLVDSGDVVVHLFRPEVRTFYNLEKLWSPLAPDERMAV